jgi:hypothetical protein
LSNRDAESELEIIMANSTPAKKTPAAEMRQLGGRRKDGADVPREVLPMSDVIPFPQRPTKTIEEETAEFLALLQRIRSSSSKEKKK